MYTFKRFERVNNKLLKSKKAYFKSKKSYFKNAHSRTTSLKKDKVFSQLLENMPILRTERNISVQGMKRSQMNDPLEKGIFSGLIFTPATLISCMHFQLKEYPPSPF